MKTINFYTLLYIDLEEGRKMSLGNYTGVDRIIIFLKNACALDASFHKLNPTCQHITILTNNKTLIEDLLSNEILYKGILVKEISFKLNVPKGIPFYSAHFKIDAFGYLASQDENKYSVLLDSDIVALKPLPHSFFRIAEEGTPILYQMPYYTADALLECCDKIVPEPGVIQWVGGEFMGGGEGVLPTTI